MGGRLQGRLPPDSRFDVLREANRASCPTSRQSTGIYMGLLWREIKVDVEVDVDTDNYFGCFKGVSKPVQVLLNAMETVMILT